jgi:hypothetical protein
MEKRNSFAATELVTGRGRIRAMDVAEGITTPVERRMLVDDRYASPTSHSEVLRL